MKFRIGDRVVVVDSQEGLREMQEMVGKTYTISRAAPYYFYKLAEDLHQFSFMEEWLDFAEDSNEFSEKEWEDVFGGD